MRTKTLKQKSADNLAGLQIDILQRLRSGSMSWEQIDWWRNLPFEQREALIIKQSERALYLKLLSWQETLIIETLDGKETLETAKEIFPADFDIDDGFKNLSTNNLDVSTEKQAVDIYKLVNHGTFTQIFDSFGTDLDKLCLTQAQIISFCKNNPDYFLKNVYTLFIFKEKSKLFMARVVLYPAGLGVKVRKLNEADRFFNSAYFGVVVPQQEL